MTAPKLTPLIHRLADPDPETRRAAGEDLLRTGAAALPGLVAALVGGPPEARKAASFLLGRVDGERAEIRPALMAALRDEEPKVRKNAAAALGRVGDESCAGALASALQIETVRWVRPSMVLALGNLGGPGAREGLTGIEPQTGREAQALRKARDRMEPGIPTATWRQAGEIPARLFASVPPGLEDVASAEAGDSGIAVTGSVVPGLIELGPDVHPENAAGRLRCVYDLRFLIGELPSLHGLPPQEAAHKTAAALAGAPLLNEWRRLIDSGSEALPYRFALENLSLEKGGFNTLLRAVRDTLEPLDLHDSPSRYVAQIIVDAGESETRLWFVPMFPADRRFDYRESDVGASIHPVVGACLARLVRHGTGGTLVDPTCGSATLLIERALLDPDIALHGIDVSPTATKAARGNVETASLAERVRIVHGDACDAANWVPATEIIANLPFGLRTRGPEAGLDDLYHDIAENIAKFLAPGGRALLYTSNRKLMDETLGSVAVVAVESERLVKAGGMDVGVWVVVRIS